jgi:hypothetical protein
MEQQGRGGLKKRGRGKNCENVLADQGDDTRRLTAVKWGKGREVVVD